MSIQTLDGAAFQSIQWAAELEAGRAVTRNYWPLRRTAIRSPLASSSIATSGGFFTSHNALCETTRTLKTLCKKLSSRHSFICRISRAALASPPGSRALPSMSLL